ncbi:MAG: hypothetical protein PHH01_04135 [Patescibacteria group bacterium]|nr:hypothetical protein [Patescibacteria group bacterium]
MKTTKNYQILIGLIFFVLLLSGCSYKKSEQQPLPSEQDKLSSLSGIFRSVKGVMDPLSCYCLNSGYLITKDNKEVPVCFEDNDKDIQCNQITITGDYETKKINPESTNPCPAGEMTYFNALSYSCN